MADFQHIQIILASYASALATTECLGFVSRNTGGLSFLNAFSTLLPTTVFFILFYHLFERLKRHDRTQPGIPVETALLGSEPDLDLWLDSLADDDLSTISACFVDSIDEISDIDTEHRYTNGPLLNSWIDLGGIKEILEILLHGSERLIDDAFGETFLGLLEKAYSQPNNEPDLSYRNRAFERHGFLIKEMKKVTYGKRLFKTATLSRLGVGPPTIQKGDLIFFEPRDSNFLIVRPLIPKYPQKPESQLHHRLIGESHMGGRLFWSNKQLNLASLPVQSLTLRQERTSEWTDIDDNSDKERTRILIPSHDLGSTALHTRIVSRSARKTLEKRRLEGSWAMTKWSIISKIEAYQGTEILSTAETESNGYMLFWKCACGHVGFDQYLGRNRGGVHQLLDVFQKHGIKAFVQAHGPSQPSATYLNLIRLEIFIENLYTWLRMWISASLGNKPWSSQVIVGHGRNSHIVNHSSPSFKTAAGTTNGASSSSQTTNANTLNINQQTHTAIGAATGTSGTSAQSNQPSPTPVAHVQGNTAIINIRQDFILLCMKIKRFLTTRHDLQVSTMTRDYELFQAFRREYHSRFGWAYRQFSFQTIQKISFVKFALHPRYEVDGIVPDMPPETAGHYTCDPRRPDREPALGNDFLMHRFNSPVVCFQDDICLRQFPKRVGERPTPGIDPDFYTGWGMHLEQGLDLQRIFLVLFFGIASAGTFGLVWGVCKSVQDGFSIASFIVGSEAVAVAVVQILLSVGAI